MSTSVAGPGERPTHPTQLASHRRRLAGPRQAIACYGMDLDTLTRSLGPLQEAMKKSEAERQSALVTGSAGGGAVQVLITGGLQVTKLTIAPAAAASCATDPSMLEDLILAAMNDALRQYRNRFGASSEEQLQKTFAGGGMGALLGPLMASLGKR